MKTEPRNSMEDVLRGAMLPVGDQDLKRDLWPEMLRRLDEQPRRVPWFDWALAGGILGLIAVFPASIPLLFYYL